MKCDTLIVSAFGRGLWLAETLAKKGKSVILVDVSENIGKWALEDWDGPFGIFKDPELAPEQWEFLNRGVSLLPISTGYTFWLPSGPLEMGGPLLDFSLQKQSLAKECLQYLKERDPHARSTQNKYLKKLEFKKTWLAHYAHQASSTIYHDNFDSLDATHVMPLFSPFFTREVNEQFINDLWSMCTFSGVKVFKHAKIMDLSFQGKTLDGLEVASDRSGVLTAHQFIWMLSSEETARFNPRVAERLYPKGIVESSWTWVRFRLSLSDGPERDALPPYFALIQDPHFPWTHGNLCMVKKVGKGIYFDVWVRISSHRRFQRTYIGETADQIIRELKNRIPKIDISLHQMPPEYKEGISELGTPKYPVYLPSEIAKLKRASIKNLFYAGPEDWKGLDWSSKLKFQAELLNQLLQPEEPLIPPRKEHDLEIHPH